MIKLAWTVFGLAVAVSIVHYIDNVVRYDRYAGPDPTFPWINEAVIVVSWFLFTAVGLWGMRQLQLGHTSRAALALAGYSGSGLVGILHFIDVSPSAMDAFQLTFVIVDFLAGVAVLAVAIALAMSAGHRPALDGGTQRAARPLPGSH